MPAKTTPADRAVVPGLETARRNQPYVHLTGRGMERANQCLVSAAWTHKNLAVHSSDFRHPGSSPQKNSSYYEGKGATSKMRISWVLLVTASQFGFSAQAAEKPLIAPSPGWVKAVEIPTAPAKSDEGAIRILLSDQQVAFKDGATTVYAETAVQIETPQGLSAGNISFAWRPDVDTPTVHKLTIRRGDKVIDVLGSGQTFTVLRRETNLDAASLDGVLTANIQPEDLQVGDVLNFAFSISSRDPVLRGHVEAFGGTWNIVPIGKAHLRLQWPSSLPLRIRSDGALPKLQISKTADVTTAEVSLTDLQPFSGPRGAPPRYHIGRVVEASDFSSWAELGALMAPLYTKAAAIPGEGPLHDEFMRIQALSTDAKTRTEAALALVQDKIRYVALAMGEGGLVPADAQSTWSRRYGDCKGKTALLLALLRALGIKADPVAVSAGAGDGLDARLPMVGLFNHVLVRATIGEHTYWLDGTRSGDRSLDRLAVPFFGWGLPLVADNAALVKMVPPPLERPGDETTIHIDATAGLAVPAPITIDEVFRGDQAMGLNLAVASLAGEARDRALREYWRKQYNFVEVKDASVKMDESSGETTLTMKGMANMDWSSGMYETDGTSVGYDADFRREAGRDADAPFAVAYPYFSKTTEIVDLPAGFLSGKSGINQNANIDQTIAGIHYRREVLRTGTVVTITKSERSVVPEFAAKDAPAAQASLRNLADQTVYIRRPTNYRPTPAELALLLKSTPTTAEGFVYRGNALLDHGKFDEAISDFDKALAHEPKNVWALADRGIAFVWKKNYEAAETDLNAAITLDPDNPVVFRARGLLAESQGRYREAITAYDRAIELDADNQFSVGRRIAAYGLAGDVEGELQAAADAITKHPDAVDLYLLRANVLKAAGRQEEALAEAVKVSKANPTSTFAQVAAGKIYAAFGRQTEALAAFDRALSIKPEGYIYVNRAYSRPKADVSGRLADIDEALKLEPGMSDALVAKAELLKETGDLIGAIATYTSVIASAPDEPAPLTGRGIAYTQTGQTGLAEKDFAAARKLAKDDVELNNMCWSKAVAGVALQSALLDCDAALAKTPGQPAFLDSRGLVLLRLGRLDDAIATYNAALAASPGLANSLYGRAIAWDRKGEPEKAAQDRKAALRITPDIAKKYKDMGLNGWEGD